jgi:hypothetical protein
MDKKESIYSISRGILNRKMIDLAENAGAEFSLNKKFGMLHYLTLRCILEKPKEVLGKIKVRYGIWC